MRAGAGGTQQVESKATGVSAKRGLMGNTRNETARHKVMESDSNDGGQTQDTDGARAGRR